MGTQSEQLERKAQQARARLTETLKELRAGLTPGQVVDQLADYAREGPAAWLIIASSQSSRARAKHSTVREVGEISTGTSVEASASSEGAYAQVEAVRQALMPLPAAGLEYPGDSATSSAPSLNEAMRQQTRRQDARAMEQAHEP
jgi:hypothetical protein